MGIVAQPRSVWLIPTSVLILLLLAILFDAGHVESRLAALQTQGFQRLLPVAALNARLAIFEALGALAFAGLVLIVLLARAGVWWAALFACLAAAAAMGAGWYLYAGPHIVFDALAVDAALLLVLLCGAIALRAALARNRARLRALFADTLSPEAIAHAARRPKLLTLDGEGREVSYLSLSLRDFTDTDADPQGFAARSQRIFEALIDQARAHGASIAEVTPDGLGCFWNAPLEDPDHALHACEAASGLLETVGRLNEALGGEREGTQPLRIEIGIASGPAVTSMLQSHGRLRYRASGACVLAASDIRRLADRYGPPILVAEETARAAQRGFAFLEVDYIDLGGTAPVRVFAMMGNSVMRAGPKFRALSTFHDHIFQTLHAMQWEKARALIAQCRKLSGASQPVYDLHLARIAYYEANPPPADRDGAFRPILK